MRVLLCSPINTGGGICRWTENILNYYKERSSDCEIVQFYGNKPTSQNISVSIFRRIFNGLNSYYPIYRGVKKMLHNGNFDVLHLCSSASISLLKDLLILNSANKIGVKTVIHFHFGRIPELYSKKNWEYKLLKEVVSIADTVVVIDKRSYDTLVNDGFSNVQYLPNPLTPVIEMLIKKYSDVTRVKGKIVFAGHVIITKGIIELVKACKEIPNIKLSVLGKVQEQMRNTLIDIAGDNNEDWLNILGERDLEFTIKEMLSSNVFVLPTYTEGFPNVIIESMACACPIVTTDVGAIPEMLDIKNGFNCGICVKPKDVEGLKVAINHMLNDKNYADQCGLNAKRRVTEQYSMPIIWNKLCSIWKTI